MTMSTTKVSFAIPLGIIICCVFFLIYGRNDKLTIQSEIKENNEDIADIFVPVGSKYNLKNNIIYHCLSGAVFKNTDSHNEPRAFSSDISGHIGEKADDRAKSFQEVFAQQKWIQKKTPGVDKMSENFQASGPGSTLEAAQTPLSLLNSLIERLKIYLQKPVITILDIPCGDFFWIKQMVGRRADVQYTGIDIVPSLIERHSKNFKSWENTKFLNLDIVKSGLNQSYDIIFCRDMLQHLAFADVLKVLEHFSSSGSKLLVTTQMHNAGNSKLNRAHTYRYRDLNLMASPINLVAPICSVDDNHLNGMKELAVWKLPLQQRP